MSISSEVKFYKTLEKNVQSLVQQFSTIPPARKAVLKQISDFIQSKVKAKQKIELIFICTHNSRRSHIAQVWAHAAASFYGIRNITSHSGGTEISAFNLRAVEALKKAGFKIHATSKSKNPIYEVRFSPHENEIITYSKKYDSPSNPKKGFAAIMVCSHADDNCPVVHGAEKRISLPYDDPKDFDGTPEEDLKYAERVMEIGKEILFAFSQVDATIR